MPRTIWGVLAVGALVALLSNGSFLQADTVAVATERTASVRALSVATPLGGGPPHGEVETISCRASLSCGRCHLLSVEFAQAAAQDPSWVDPSSCKEAEVSDGNGAAILVDGITVMSDTLDSVRAAVLYLRDFAPKEYRIPGDFLSLYDLSFTLSRVPLITRGTSAGLAFLLSAYSAISGVPLIPEVAVTGAIEADGRVGPVGSIVQKILAAERLGYSTVIIPAANGSDLALPPDLPKRIRMILVDTADQALFHALGQAGPRGAEYEAMYQGYLAAVSLAEQGKRAEALEAFLRLANMFPEDYSLRVWIEYLRSTSPSG